MSRRSAWIKTLALAALVVLVDQVSKSLVESHIAVGERVDLIGPLQLTNVGNTGIAFGLAGGGGRALVLLTLVAVVMIVIVFARDPSRPGIWPAVGLLLGGAVGNLIDRVAHEAVTDFIRLPMWPAFNVADIAITVGVVLLGWSFLREPPVKATGVGEGVEGAGVGEGDAVDGEASPPDPAPVDRG